MYPLYHFDCKCIISVSDVVPYAKINGKRINRPLCPHHLDRDTRIVKKSFICIECGIEFDAFGKSNHVLRCPNCRDQHHIEEMKIEYRMAKIVPLEKIVISDLENPNLSPCIQGCNIWDRGQGPDQPECLECNARFVYFRSVEDPMVMVRA